MRTPTASVIVLSFVALSWGTAAAAGQATDRCTVTDYDDYYDVELDEDYGFEGVLDKTATGLYQGPLMREGDVSGVGNLKSLFGDQRELTVRRIQEIVQSHLYDNEEFRNLLQEKTDELGELEASHQIRESIYDAFGYEAASPSEQDFDACLIRNRQAHLVVTKALIEMSGVTD